MNAIIVCPPSSPARLFPSSDSIPLVSSDPSWWLLINAEIIGSYSVVAACVMAIYDWGGAISLRTVLYVELFWGQRWSMMTVLYLVARYGGIGFVVKNILLDVPTIPTTDGVRVKKHLLSSSNMSQGCLGEGVLTFGFYLLDLVLLS
ncbi:hypothetical protein BDR06DRAFT_1008994 [Suillus hirtellus]|nr:hypothetical protein BDR06DRAFT_1008994 [Suillus hirtellus]